MKLGFARIQFEFVQMQLAIVRVQFDNIRLQLEGMRMRFGGARIQVGGVRLQFDGVPRQFGAMKPGLGLRFCDSLTTPNSLTMDVRHVRGLPRHQTVKDPPQKSPQ